MAKDDLVRGPQQIEREREKNTGFDLGTNGKHGRN